MPAFILKICYDQNKYTTKYLIVSDQFLKYKNKLYELWYCDI